MPKVSVIVPIYNAEEYLRQCLDSIVNQTLRDIEIILINDGSTDNSAEICEKYYSSDERVKYYSKDNEGLAAARQDGMEIATGEYIGFVDSDDWLELNMYEKMYEAAKSNNSDVAFCNCIQNENDYYFKPEMPTGAYGREQIEKDILPKTLAYINDKGDKRVIRWCNWLRIYRRAFIEEHNIAFDRRFRRSQDSQLTYESMLYAQNFYYLGDDYLYHNRVVGDSLSRGYTKNMWPLYVNLINRLYSDTEMFPELDLMPQMHLRAFFFACECIDNELKPTCPHDRKTSEKLIAEIINDPICDRFYGHIEVDKLNLLLRAYYKFIHEKKADKFIPFAKKYQQSQQRKAEFRKLLVRLTETRLYKAIRHR